MKHVILSTLFSLLLTSVQSQPSREVNLINQLNEFFDFNINIFLLDESVEDNNRHIPINAKSDGHFTPQAVYTFGCKNNSNVKTQMEQLKTLMRETRENIFLIFVATESSLESTNNGSTILDEVITVLTIQQVRRKVKFGIFFEKNHSSMEMVFQIFQKSWSNKILNIFCAFYSNHNDDAMSSLLTVYRYDPFGAAFLINFTGMDLQSYFSSDNEFPNYHQHPIRLFKYQRHIISDFAANYWQTVTRIFNASILVVIIPEEDFIDGVLDKIKDDAGIFRQNVNKSPNEIVLYPDEIKWFQLMVPHAQPYSSIVGYLQNTTWMILFGYVFGVIATASLLLNVSGHLQSIKRNSIFQCVVDVVNLMMNDNMAIKYGQLHRADIFIVVPLTFTGLIMSNGILSVFKSYLTAPIYQHQIKTLAELYKSELPIVSEAVFWANDTIELLEGLTGLDWHEKVRRVKRAPYDTGMEQLNNSVAYSALSSEVRMFLIVQKRFNMKAFYSIMDPPLVQIFTSFPVKPNYPFLEQLQLIHHRLWTHGLLQKWDTDTNEKEISRIAKAKSLSLQLQSNSDDSGSNSFGIITIIWCGWIAGGIVFICELVWNKIQIIKLKHAP